MALEIEHTIEDFQCMRNNFRMSRDYSSSCCYFDDIAVSSANIYEFSKKRRLDLGRSENFITCNIPKEWIVQICEIGNYKLIVGILLSKKTGRINDVVSISRILYKDWTKLNKSILAIYWTTENGSK